MPPPILADSDDDGEGSSLENNEASVPDALPPAQGLDGTDDRSTSSDERLIKEIRSAERRAFNEESITASTAKDASGGTPSGSQMGKRRHTSAFGAGTSVSPEKRVKRTKTLKTYSTKRSPARPVELPESGDFARLREDKMAAPATSESAHYTEHEVEASSNALPAGSIQKDFIDHEPTVMFCDTGTTAADGESSQRRMVEQALGRSGNTTSALQLPLTSEEQTVSSFPWSASGQTPSGNRAGVMDEVDGVMSQHLGDDVPEDEVNGVTSQPVDDDVPENVSNEEATEQAAPSKKEADTVAREHSPDRASVNDDQPEVEYTPAQDQQAKLRSSPRVEITVRSGASPPPDKASASKAKKGRKRAAEKDVLVPPDSDELDIGLPKELYQPRPSRRRTMQTADLQVDFSKKPEDIAKARRRKTTVAAPSPKPELVPDHTSTAVSAQVDTAEPDFDAQTVFQEWLKNPLPKLPSKPDDVTKAEFAQEPSVKSPTASPISAGGKADQSTELSSPQKASDEIFVKPAPKRKSASTKAEARRSHTTIFEDHVDFNSDSRRTPTLSQQQEARKSTLESTPERGVVRPTQRKRRNVVDEDDEGEDELASNGLQPQHDTTVVDNSTTPQQDAESVPKKRGRGRPSRNNTAARNKSNEKILEGSDVEKDDDGIAVEAGALEPVKKKGRGRPRKASAKEQPEHGLMEFQQAPAQTEEALTQAQDDEDKNTPTVDKVPESLAQPEHATASKPSTPALQAPTPSPEQPAPTSAKVTPTKKPDPTSHSPIKSSSKVPYRVGLSKRQRIPSLLRMLKPPRK